MRNHDSFLEQIGISEGIIIFVRKHPHPVSLIFNTRSLIG